MASDVIAWVILGAVVANSAATVFLAWRTSNLAGSTDSMATATNTTAAATYDSVALQREELDAVKEQLKLARGQSELANRQLELATRQFEQTAEVVKHQLQQPEATAVMAKELQRERELATRPYLTVEVLHPSYLDDLVIHNVGRGPALNCTWAYLEMPATRWRRSKVFHVAPGTGRRLRATDIFLNQPGDPIFTPLMDPGPLNESGAPYVADVHNLFCQDETGTRLYRFIEGRAGYDVWEGDDPQPSWATFLLQEFPGFQR